MVATSRRISEYSLTVQADPLEKISKIWSDPVFTQVIAAVVIFAGGAVLLFLRDQLFPGLTEERALFILCGLTAVALAAVLLFAQAPRATATAAAGQPPPRRSSSRVCVSPSS